MLDMFKKKLQSERSGKPFKCECGNDTFRRVSRLLQETYTFEGRATKDFCEDFSYAECTKCGALYNPFDGEKVLERREK